MHKDENYKAEMRRRKRERSERTPAFTAIIVNRKERIIKHVRLERNPASTWEHPLYGEVGPTEVVEDVPKTPEQVG